MAKIVDALLVGAGAMSSTLATLLNQLDPTLKVAVVERLADVAVESTYGWNNAGTGHAAYCELNYTPETDGKVDITKAKEINAAFEISQQFWTYLVNSGVMPDPKKFINRTPHLSFVWGQKNVEFLRQRYELMSKDHQFAGMQYSEDPELIQQWMPLVMNGRKDGEPVAATKVERGADVDFGALARTMIRHLQSQDSFDLMLGHSAVNMKPIPTGGWTVLLKNNITGKRRFVRTKFLFLGAGGGAVRLLQKSKIKEGRGYGGFPVSGQWLVCTNPEVVKQHNAKVYGKAAIGAPPMSVPHLDTRNIGGETALLFGPFAGFTTKFLKEGSNMDLPKSIKGDNIKPMLSVGLNNMSLTKYLISEAMQSQRSRMKSLRQYYPEARDEDWTLLNAGKRVQIIKKDEKGKGKLEFGTEIVASADGSLAALLGASPGASTSTQTMISVLERCFAEQMENQGWKEKLKTMIPSYGESLRESPELLAEIRAKNLSTLKLDAVD
ncbi:malate dehydrogenase (quinone) [Dasania sp. GY-MA-18]|uniref:Probable malate:quinone oxidoreductase n=1 Tax=Dasania phycosphaerae TaxID=2950436 RepID=A0A9J6RHW2_9GAMM|nr:MULTISPECIES: malate dehydrogenase (quinone) [Dasania]MCR8921501.1 malate dehydrogenase (quinone) [Dasania sp. GY-MA-18]MCZ0863929.1 malate dehydrogenase (quinone) [Dasania phycosphaerae]MCZ0867657.1 malate dehydrogenase (quinone) [Dasania phycosphaerae]